MSVFAVVPGQTVYDQFPALEDDGITKRPGLTVGAGDFIVTTYKDCVITPLAVAITDISGTGEYCLEYTPPDEGFWVVEVLIDFSGDCFKSITQTVAANLATVIDNLNRALSLLHFNSMVDLQQYNDPNEQLTNWRHRGFNAAGNVPVTPGGNETTGKKYEHQFEAEYDGPNKPKKLPICR